jgi:tetratricopeptide (TPR) repeat protein
MTNDRPVEVRKDRYARGELSPAEARELAQASLDSPELFDELADSALAKAAVDAGVLPNEKVVRFPHKIWIAVGTLAASAALALLWFPAPKPQLKPVLALTPGQPVLLASGLQPDQSPVFRGAQTDSRAARTSGLIVSIEEGLAIIDLGSLDGLAIDSELLVFRDDRPAETIGRLQVTTVFRERARGRIVEGRVQVKDRVRVGDADRLDALVEQVDALYNRPDADGAYNMAEQASRWVESANVPPVRQAEFWNQLAVMRMLRGDYQNAEAALNRGATASDPRSMNNRGVLAELRGDRRTAESRYADALGRNPPDAERRIIEANLARVRGSH